MTELHDMPGHLARRFQQIAVAIFHAEVGVAGFDLTPVQYAALRTIADRPRLDQATLAGLIAHDRTTIGGVVDRLVQKGFVDRKLSARDRRARELEVTPSGKDALAAMKPAVEQAQHIMLHGLSDEEAGQLLALLRKVIEAGNELSRAPMRVARTRGQQSPST